MTKATILTQKLRDLVTILEMTQEGVGAHLPADTPDTLVQAADLIAAFQLLVEEARR